jgi:hypothetical protein
MNYVGGEGLAVHPVAEEGAPDAMPFLSVCARAAPGRPNEVPLPADPENPAKRHKKAAVAAWKGQQGGLNAKKDGTVSALEAAKHPVTDSTKAPVSAAAKASDSKADAKKARAERAAASVKAAACRSESLAATVRDLATLAVSPPALTVLPSVPAAAIAAIKTEAKALVSSSGALLLAAPSSVAAEVEEHTTVAADAHAVHATAEMRKWLFANKVGSSADALINQGFNTVDELLEVSITEADLAESCFGFTMCVRKRLFRALELEMKSRTTAATMGSSPISRPQEHRPVEAETEAETFVGSVAVGATCHRTGTVPHNAMQEESGPKDSSPASLSTATLAPERARIVLPWNRGGGGAVRLRVRPDPSRKPRSVWVPGLTNLMHNEKCSLVRREGSAWCLIRSQRGEEGYVKAEYVVVTDEPQPQPTHRTPSAKRAD